MPIFCPELVLVVQTEKNFPTGSVVVGHWLTDLLQLAALEQSLKLLRPFELRKEVRNADILLQFSLQSTSETDRRPGPPSAAGISENRGAFCTGEEALAGHGEGGRRR